MFDTNNFSYGLEKANNFKTKRNFNFIKNNGYLYLVLALIIIKSVLLIGLVSTPGGSKLNIGYGFFSTTVIYVYLLFPLTILSFAFLFKGRAKLWFLVVIDIAVTAFIISDLMYFRAFGGFITLHLIKQSTNLDNLGSSISSMLRYLDIIFVIDIPILITLILRNKNSYRNSKINLTAFLAMFILSSGLLYLIHYKVDVLEKGENKILFRTCWAPTQTMSNLSPIGYHMHDAYNFWKDSIPYKLTKEDKSNIDKWFNMKPENLPDNKYKGMLKGKNLLLLQVESLEGFVINKSINNQVITPNINGLLKNSLYFTNFHEQVYNGTSSDSDLMANTSVYPVRRGSTFFRFPNNSYNSLPNLLEGLGYSSLAIHPDKGSYWNWMPALTSIGFNKCIDSTSFKMDETIGLGLSDGSYLRQVVPMIKEQKQPFYTFMVTLSSHSPFDIEEKYRELKLPESLEKTKLGGYFQSIHYTDKQIGMFLSKLQEEGLLDNTTVVIFGDHEGVHKFYNDELSSISPSEDWWFNNNYKIPFIVFNKDLAGEEIQTTGAQVDILPTVSYLMGVEENKYVKTALGRNLLNTNRDFALLSNRKIVGKPQNEDEEKWVQYGIDISDLIIRSNYFKNHK